MRLWLRACGWRVRATKGDFSRVCVVGFYKRPTSEAKSWEKYVVPLVWVVFGEGRHRLRGLFGGPENPGNSENAGIDMVIPMR